MTVKVLVVLAGDPVGNVLAAVVRLLDSDRYLVVKSENKDVSLALRGGDAYLQVSTTQYKEVETIIYVNCKPGKTGNRVSSASYSFHCLEDRVILRVVNLLIPREEQLLFSSELRRWLELCDAWLRGRRPEVEALGATSEDVKRLLDVIH